MQNFKVQHQTPRETKKLFRLLQPLSSYRQKTLNANREKQV